MNELRQALLAGEDIVFETRKHWMAPLRDSLIAILLLIVAGILGALAPGGGEGLIGSIGGFLGNLMWWIAVGCFVVGVVWIIGNIVAWLSANFGVSNMRVLRYEGIIRKRASETLLSSVTDVKLTTPALGNMLGYGDITILTASGADGRDDFTTIRHANEFRTALQNAQAQTKATAAPAAMTPEALATPPPPRAPAPTATVGATGSTGPIITPGPTEMAPAPVASVATSSTTDDTAASLERLADLHAKGVITDGEFEAKKAELLGRI